MFPLLNGAVRAGELSKSKTLKEIQIQFIVRVAAVAVLKIRKCYLCRLPSSKSSYGVSQYELIRFLKMVLNETATKFNVICPKIVARQLKRVSG